MAATSLQHSHLLKMKSKRDPQLESEILNWISEKTGEKIPSGTYENALKDGVLLCKVVEKIQPGAIGKINLPANEEVAHFKKVENVGKFLTAIVKLGVPELDIFKTDDLVDQRNIPQVTTTILALRRIADKK